MRVHVMQSRMTPGQADLLQYFLQGISEAFRCLGRKKLEVPALDATTIAVSMLLGDFDTAGTIMFLLDIGGLLEDWTHKKSVDDLAQRMYLNVDKVWLKTGGTEVLFPVKEVSPGM